VSNFLEIWHDTLISQIWEAKLVNTQMALLTGLNAILSRSGCCVSNHAAEADHYRAVSPVRVDRVPPPATSLPSPASGCMHCSLMSADVETGQLLLHSLVLDGVDERVHADVQVREEQSAVVVQV